MGRPKKYLTKEEIEKSNRIKSNKHYKKFKIPTHIVDVEINFIVKTSLGLYKKSGIYKIVNKVNENFYIGSAVNLSKRIFSEHIKSLKENKHYNKRLQKDWNSVGENNFCVYIVEFVSDKSLLIKREQHYLDALLSANEENNDFYRLGYNLCREAGSLLGVKMSEETKLKIGLGNKGKKYFGEKNPFYGKKHTKQSILNITKNNKMRGMASPRRKSVLQYSLNGKLIKEWSYVSEAEKYYNKEFKLKYKGLISGCCNGKYNTAYGYNWKHKI